MQFVHYQNKRPNNSLQFWTAFVQEYFAPGAHIRVTLSGSGPTNNEAQGCEARSLEAPLEVLPRLFHLKYDSGLKEELLYLSDPQEIEVPGGRHMLTSTLAVEESVFETLRIKRYGRLMVLLTPAMKIITYDFNMLGYDYSVPQPVILNELGALMQQFQQYQQNAAEADSANGPKPHEVMQIAVNALANLGHGFEGETARLVEHGYVRRYMRSLQIADVVNSMTDLMHMSQQEPSPISALQQFHMAMTNSQQEQSPDSLHSMPTVTSVGPHASPGDQQQQQQQLGMHLQQQQQQQLRSNQQHDYQNDVSMLMGPAASGGQNGVGGSGLPALSSPRHSNRSGSNPFVQQPQPQGRPPTPRSAKRS